MFIFLLVVISLLFCASICCSAQPIQPTDASGFVLLTEVVPDAIIEIRYYSTYNFVGDRIDGYEEPIALLSEEAALALRAVSDELVQKGYRLKIYDAYRPQSAVDHFVRWAKDKSDIRMKPYFYPELDKGALFKQSYIAQKSGHSRGSTVDLTLFDISTGKEVDMGGTFDYFGKKSHPEYSNITAEQHANRMLLREAMTAHGFKPLSTEWWHFTLKSEPYPDTYFSFPVTTDVLTHSGKQKEISAYSGDPDGAPAHSENQEADSPQSGISEAQATASPLSKVKIYLSRGMKGEAVHYYQERLIVAGYLTDSADGSFGARTESAVKRFQQANGLEPTGIITNVEADLLSVYQ